MVKQIRIPPKTYTARRRVKSWTSTRNGKKITMNKRVSSWTVRRKGHLRKDMGAPGRTPKAKRWYKPKGDLGGWKKDLPTDKRRLLAFRSTPKSYTEERRLRLVIKQLVALANVTTDKETESRARSDADYFSERLAGHQNPVFTPDEQKVILSTMVRNYEMGRHKHLVGSFREGHRLAEDQLREEGYIIDKSDVQGRLEFAFGYRASDPDRPLSSLEVKEIPE